MLSATANNPLFGLWPFALLPYVSGVAGRSARTARQREGDMNILLTGGAGYIGSHTAVALTQAGHRIVLLDNYANGLNPRSATGWRGFWASR